jgi:hypothetical protein
MYTPREHVIYELDVLCKSLIIFDRNISYHDISLSPEEKRPGHGVDHPSLLIAEVKGRVELHL